MQKRATKLIHWGIGAGSLATVACGMEIAARSGLYDASLVPPPTAVLRALRTQLTTTLLGDTLATLRRVVQGLLVGATLGWLVGLATALSRKGRVVLEP